MPEEAEDRDAALVAAVAGRDEEAFTVLYRRFLPVVLRWCLRETGNRELAADLSSEVFAAALISARRYRAEQGSVAAWLLGIARNKLLESRRRKRVEDSARRRLRLESISLSDADLDRVEEFASLDAEILVLSRRCPVRCARRWTPECCSSSPMRRSPLSCAVRSRSCASASVAL